MELFPDCPGGVSGVEFYEGGVGGVRGMVAFYTTFEVTATVPSDET